MSNSPLFNLRDVGMSYPLARSAVERIFNRNRFHAVQGVNLAVHKGDSFAIVGESGSGKSTVARMMVGLSTPTAGLIEYDGMNIGDMSKRSILAFRDRVQMVFQSTMNSLNPRKTIATALDEASGLHGLSIKTLLDMVQLPSTMLSRYPHQLSGGQRQRVGIARALARQPEMIIADEPTSALDVSIQAEVIRLLQDLHKETNLTLMVISHDLALVSELCQRVAVMRQGKIVEMGDTQKVLFTPSQQYTADLLAAIPKGVLGRQARSAS